MNLQSMKELSEEDQKILFAKISVYRKSAKVANYSATYGAQAATVARQAMIPLGNAGDLLSAYWKRNWSIKAIADNCIVKTVREKGDSQKWLYNPVSKFWYTLRHDKDRFSTLNQGTASYIFDLWLGYVLEKREQITGQFHDEFILTIRKGFRDEATRLLRYAIDKVNDTLKLNREMDIDIQFGERYSEIH